MNRFRRITVALADAPTDEALLQYAKLIRDRICTEAGFQFVHVLPDPSTVSLRAMPAIRTHRAALESIRNRVKEHFEDGQECLVLNGYRVDGLLEHAAESGTDAVLLGHRRARSGRRSLARRLAMKAPCSLWLVPEGSPVTITKVLVGVDFSTSSAQALSVGALVASRAGKYECTAVHVVNPEEGVDGTSAFDRFLAGLDLYGTSIQPRVAASGPVTRTILDIARIEGADLIVMGARGRSSSAAVLLGTESEQLLMESGLPVLITRPRGERLALLQVLLDRDLQAR